MRRQISNEDVEKFLNGHNPMERVISLECGYNDDMVNVIYVNEDGEKRVKKDEFKPFAWAKNSACIRMFDGDRNLLKSKMREYGITVKGLITKYDDSQTNERLETGYRYIFSATKKMTFSRFLSFFREAGTPIYGKERDEKGTKEFIVVPPIEQHMITTGKRLFKGFERYDDLKRMLFDIETQGLNPRVHAIDQIGIRTNKGYEKIITVTGTGKEREQNELKAIEEFVSIIAKEKPDIIAGHNSENFDWDFIIVRCEVLGSNFMDITNKYFVHPIYKKKKEAVLKLGGEMEYYFPTVAWGFNILDSLHAVRRAQAIDSNMKSASLKYTTKYLGLKKENRVYVPGNIITQTWNVTDENYAFRDSDGDWYELKNGRTVLTDKGYRPCTGKYIVERYLLDDLWETDKVELTLNEANFLVSKLLPTSFTRACTMGTAGIWKLIMLAWSYENNLAVPAHIPNKRFVGGLSRLLKTGYVDRVVKLDFNSLYPATILTWNIPNETDIDNILNRMLEYILTNREKYKDLKGAAGKKVDELKEKLENESLTDEEKVKIKEEIAYWKAEKASNDKKQLPLKILANSYFGSNGCPAVFPWGSLISAEKTTCTGRMELRLMISHFTNIGYTPIVGDSFTGDTPLFIKYNETDAIDIKPIEELISKTEVDALGREYDTSEKPYKVLCRSGWIKPEYIYRHKTNKPLYEVSEGDMSVTVTEDHSLFTEDKKKIKPSELKSKTKLEYHKDKAVFKRDFWFGVDEKKLKVIASMLKNGTIDRVPIVILNSNEETIRGFLDILGNWDYSHTSKTCRAGMNYLKNIGRL